MSQRQFAVFQSCNLRSSSGSLAITRGDVQRHVPQEPMPFTPKEDRNVISGILAVCAYIILLTATVLWALMKPIHQEPEPDRLHASQGPSGICAPENQEAH